MKLLQQLNEIAEKKVHRVKAGTFTEPKKWEPSNGLDRDDPKWDWRNPNDNPSGKKPESEQPHKVNGKWSKENYPIVFDDAEDSIHLFDPNLIKQIKKDLKLKASEWEKMSELEQIKTQLDFTMLPPTKAQMSWTGSQWDAMWDREAKKLQKQIKRG